MSALDTLMVTTGPIPPLTRYRWRKGNGVFGPAAHGKNCLMQHVWRGRLRHREQEEQRIAWDHEVNAIALAMFPDRAVSWLGTTAQEHTCVAGRVNDHPDTTFADVCKILDEANRRLA